MPVRIFISYSHDDDNHTARVRDLAIRLRQDGFDAQLDQFETPHPPDGWPVWSGRQIVAAQYVLLVCTEKYYKRFIGLTDLPHEGRGVKWESRYIQNLLYYDYVQVGFLPVLYSRKDEKFIPPAVSGAGKILLHDESRPDHDGYQKLREAMGYQPHWPAIPIPTARELAVVASSPAAVIPDEASVLTLDVWNAFTRVLHNINHCLEARVAPPLFLPDVSTAPKPGPDTGVTDLRYDRQWLAHRERPEVQLAWNGFLGQPVPFAWWGIVGEGGVGKTREAFELALILKQQGWDAGFLRGQDTTTWLQHDCKGWRPRRPTLIIIDYAAQRAGALIEGLLHLSESLGQQADEAIPPVRVLLLDRPGRIYPTSSELIPEQAHGGEIRDRIRKFLYCAPGTTLAMNDDRDAREGVLKRGLSEPLFRDTDLLVLKGMDRSEWRSILSEATTQADGDPTLLPDVNDDDWWERVDRLTGHGRLLFLQIMGLCLARNPDLVSGLSVDDGLRELLDNMLDHEIEHRWPDLFPPTAGANREAIRKSPAFQHVLRAAAFVTLCRGLSLPDHADQLRQAAGGSAELLQTVLLRILRSDVAVDYEQKTHIQLPPLEPDLIGERMLLILSRREVDASDPFGLVPQSSGIDLMGWMQSAIQINPFGTGQTLLLLAIDFPHEAETVQWISAFVDCAAQLDSSDKIQSAASAFLPWLVASMGIRDVDLTSITSRYPGHPALQLAVSEGAVALINSFGTAEVWSSLERWGEVLQAQSRQFPDHAEIQLALSKGAVNAVHHYGKAQDWSSLERWGEVLKTQSRQFPDHAEIQLALSEGAMNAVTNYGTTQDWSSLERWGEVLQAQSRQFPDHAEIQLELSKGAFNAVNAYGKAQDWSLLERWGEVLLEQSRQFPDHAEIQLALSDGAINAVNYYSGAQDWSSLERWGEVLKAQSRHFPDHAEIQLALSEGAFNAVFHYGTAQNWSSLERWGEVLKAQSRHFPDHTKIQLWLSKGAMNAVSDYGTAQDWASLERWGEVLGNALPASSVDGEAFQQMCQIILSNADSAKEPRWADVAIKLAAYWPGFLLQIGHGSVDVNVVPLAFLAAEIPFATADQSAKIAELKSAVGDWYIAADQLNEQIQNSAIDPTLVEWLWQRRMCSPDRCDRLVPLVSDLNLNGLLQEAMNDPWRRQDGESDL